MAVNLNVSDQSIHEEHVLTRRASYVSLVVSILLLAAKYWAYRATQSQAVFSDAMESIVNVVAAGLAILVIAVAYKPADKDHPYGHGKVEFFSAAFEGGLIAFASLFICIEAIRALINHQSAVDLGIGVAVVGLTGIANALLGFFLLFVGKKKRSIALQASGQHVLSDFWTSLGVVIGLVLVHYTGFMWLDSAIALLLGLVLARTGFNLVRRSIGGLLDEEDRGILEKLLEILSRERSEGIIQIHHVRVIRSGDYHHIDAHAVVPEFWDVQEAHEKTDAFEAKLIKAYPNPGELHLHVDPCRRVYCRNCDLKDCPIRMHPFEKIRKLSIEELTSPEEPVQFLR